MPRTERINEHLRDKLAEIMAREMPLDNALITVTYVACDRELKNANVGISVLPAKMFGSTLEKIKKHAHIFSHALKSETKLRKIPRFHWRIDDTEEKAAEIEELLATIKNK